MEYLQSSGTISCRRETGVNRREKVFVLWGLHAVMDPGKKKKGNKKTLMSGCVPGREPDLGKGGVKACDAHVGSGGRRVRAALWKRATCESQRKHVFFEEREQC